MRKRKVLVITKDPLLKIYLQDRLRTCDGIELVDGTSPTDATVMETDLLTPNEIELLQKVADYGSIERVAGLIRRSVATVKRELSIIREKIGVKTTLQAIVWAMRWGIIR